MLTLITQNKFKKDLKLAVKRGKSLAKFRSVVIALQNQEPLAEKHREHNLSGQWKSYNECHIEPDWLLIYRVSDDSLELARTGTHSDLF